MMKNYNHAKKTLLILLFHIIYGNPSQFDYSSNKITVNKLYTYEFSRNAEKYKPLKSHYYYYIKTNNIVEELRANPNNVNVFESLIIYNFNWEYMMLEKSEYSLQGYSNDDYDKLGLHITIENKFNVDFKKNIFSFSYTNKLEDGPKIFSVKNRLNNYPTYFYRFTSDFDLTYSLKFYPIGEEKIIVNEHSDGYNYEVAIKYLGKEKITVPYGTVLCHKFKMEPNSFVYRLLSKDIFIWLTAEDEAMYLVKYENNNARDSFHPHIEFRLMNVKEMAPEEWGNFKVSFTR